MPDSTRFLKLAAIPALAALVLMPGCLTMIAGSAELDDESMQRTQAKDNEERMRRMREGNSVRPAEYNALNNKLGGGDGGEIAPKPSIEELERRTSQR